jgi:hypothetical protein
LKLTAETVQEKGGFTGQPVKREISWKGDTYDVYVRRLSYRSAVDDARAYGQGASAIAAHRIANCIVDENGQPIFSVEHITGVKEDGSPVMIEKDGEQIERGAMDDDLATALMLVISEVNNLGKKRATAA